jgi:acyl-CoA thioesterase FadM
VPLGSEQANRRDVGTLAEIELLRSLSIDAHEANDYPRRHVEVEYLLPLQFDDEVKVQGRVAPGRDIVHHVRMGRAV